MKLSHGIALLEKRWTEAYREKPKIPHIVVIHVHCMKEVLFNKRVMYNTMRPSSRNLLDMPDAFHQLCKILA